MIFYLLLTVFLAVCIVLIIVILIQRASGGGLAGAFGGGGSDTVLGGLQNREMVKLTTWLAVAFVVLAILMDFIPPSRKTADVDELNTAPVTGTVPSNTSSTDQSGSPSAGDSAPLETGGGGAANGK